MTIVHNCVIIINISPNQFPCPYILVWVTWPLSLFMSISGDFLRTTSPSVTHVASMIHRPVMASVCTYTLLAPHISLLNVVIPLLTENFPALYTLPHPMYVSLCDSILLMCQHISVSHFPITKNLFSCPHYLRTILYIINQLSIFLRSIF